SPTATAPSSARVLAPPAPALPRAPSPHRAARANQAPGQTPTRPALDDRAPPDHQMSPHASPADAAPAAATAAFPDPALAAPAAPANPQKAASRSAPTGSPLTRPQRHPITPIPLAATRQSAKMRERFTRSEERPRGASRSTHDISASLSFVRHRPV